VYVAVSKTVSKKRVNLRCKVSFRVVCTRVLALRMTNNPANSSETGEAALPKIDVFTTAVSFLEMLFSQTVLATGTCFFWEANGRVYLVTNWHNITGRNSISGEHLSKTLAEPDSIRFNHWPERKLTARREVEIDLYDKNGPCWLVHPVHGKLVDVVCLPLPFGEEANVFPINKLPTAPLDLKVAQDVFVLGFPMGIGVERLPIWKRASVASEPSIDVEYVPKLYIDTAGAHGMSGAPVIALNKFYLAPLGGTVFDMGRSTSFVGVYSGRVGSGDTLAAQLGIVWKSAVIDEIIAGQLRGRRI